MRAATFSFSIPSKHFKHARWAKEEQIFGLDSL